MLLHWYKHLTYIHKLNEKTNLKLTIFHIRLQDLLTLHCFSSLHLSLSFIFISSTTMQGLFGTRTARLILL